MSYSNTRLILLIVLLLVAARSARAMTLSEHLNVVAQASKAADKFIDERMIIRSPDGKTYTGISNDADHCQAAIHHRDVRSKVSEFEKAAGAQNPRFEVPGERQVLSDARLMTGVIRTQLLMIAKSEEGIARTLLQYADGENVKLPDVCTQGQRH